MKSPAYDIAQILAAITGMGTYGSTIFVSREPISPDNCITIYDTGGFEPDVAVDYQKPTIQVRVRNKIYDAGYDVINAIKSELHGAYNISEGGADYKGIWAMSDIMSLGYDDSNRALLTCNFRIHRTPTTS